LDRLEEGVWNCIAPCAAHQQLAENLVQTANFLAQTGVGEARRSARAKNHTIFARDFNTWASDLKRKKKEKKTGQKCRPQRVVGKQRLAMFGDFADRQLNVIKWARKDVGKEKMKSIANFIRNKKLKTSSIEQEAKNNAFDKGLKKKLRKVKALNLVDLTALMEGAVILRLLNKKNNGREFLEAELDYRNKESWTKLTGRQKAEMDQKALRHLLRAQEHKRLFNDESKSVEESKISNIKPLSDKLQDWLSIQWRLINEQKGIQDDGEES
jgi:hypothetical protein